MPRKILTIAIIAVFFLFNTTNVSAVGVNKNCTTPPDNSLPCDSGLQCVPFSPCQPTFVNNSCWGSCKENAVQEVFGKIQPPDALKGFLAKDPTGAGAISQFLSNFVVLIFSVAGVVLILMIVWGAFDWIISEGDKEKVASARNKIINAIIGIILFSIAFAIIQVLGTFTGFEFFKGP